MSTEYKFVPYTPFPVGKYEVVYITPHHPEGIDSYVENDAPTMISMP